MNVIKTDRRKDRQTDGQTGERNAIFSKNIVDGK